MGEVVEPLMRLVRNGRKRALILQVSFVAMGMKTNALVGSSQDGTMARILLEPIFG